MLPRFLLQFAPGLWLTTGRRPAQFGCACQVSKVTGPNFTIIVIVMASRENIEVLREDHSLGVGTEPKPTKEQ